MKLYQDRLKRIIPKKANIKSLTWAKFYYNDNDYGKFIDKMFYNKDLILYAQREALHCWFGKIEEYNLEDTNRPFDWDHIYPHNYISGKKNIAQALRDWYSSNGNLRAWPYSLNRGDQKDAPAIKLNPTNLTNEDFVWWSKGLREQEPISTEIQLRNKLLKHSACDNKKNKWLELGSDIECKIKEPSAVRKIVDTFLERNVKLCEEWYNKLEINKLIPKKEKNVKSLFENIINQKMWKPEKEDDERKAYFLPVLERNLSIYFSFNVKGNILMGGDDGIYFGVREPENNKVLTNIEGSEKIQIDYDDDNNYYLGKWVTLNSYSENSKMELFKEFNLWLNDFPFPDKKIKVAAINRFNDSIKKHI